MPYFEKRIQSGRLLEVERYFATRSGRAVPRGEVTGDGTPLDAERVNERNAQKRLMRLICSNFSRENGDMLVTFTHADIVTEDEAMKAERAIMGKIKRLRKKMGMEELKYICVTERQGRWHTHAILNGGLSMQQLMDLWEHGRVTVSLLDDSYTYEELAKYLTKQHKPSRRRKNGLPEDNGKQQRRKWQRRWHASHNLEKPVETKREIKRKVRLGEPKAPKGYRLLPGWYQGADALGNVYTYAAFVAEPNEFTVVKGSGRSPAGLRGRAPCQDQTRKGRT